MCELNISVLFDLRNLVIKEDLLGETLADMYTVTVRAVENADLPTRNLFCNRAGRGYHYSFVTSSLTRHSGASCVQQEVIC